MEYALIGLIVAMALLFMVRRTFKALARSEGGCGCGCGSSCPSNANNAPGKAGAARKAGHGVGVGPACCGCDRIKASPKGRMQGPMQDQGPIPFFAHSNENDNQLQGKE